MTVFVGTSGWQYDDWRGVVYEPGVPKSRWLEAYTQMFDIVESNNAFYRLPERHTFEAWAERTPSDFLFTVKMSRFLTHIKRLRDPEEPVARFLDRAVGLGRKLAAVLLQLPPTLRADHAALESTLRLFPSDVRVSVEFRHDSWWTAETRALLERYGAALCLADGDLGSDAVKPRRKSQPVSALWRTAGWGYLRFHHGAAKPDPCYGRSSLEGWADRLLEVYDRDADVYVFFNNDWHGCAPANAHTFALALKRRGLSVSKTTAGIVPRVS
ncbi:MAG TPA: DUF72 domain-containing protein [Actinomycetota bacterium]|jgi:uncharacterized protein YecE (DUF72 family)|nr:DUF72 domain-containing protein [Actinomycetota bacterium]